MAFLNALSQINSSLIPAFKPPPPPPSPCTPKQPKRNREHALLGKFVVPRHAFHRSTVRDHHPWEGPILPQVLLQQIRASACRNAIHSIVGAHHTLCMAFCHAGFKCWQICVHCIPEEATSKVHITVHVVGAFNSCSASHGHNGTKLECCMAVVMFEEAWFAEQARVPVWVICSLALQSCCVCMRAAQSVLFCSVPLCSVLICCVLFWRTFDVSWSFCSVFPLSLSAS